MDGTTNNTCVDPPQVLGSILEPEDVDAEEQWQSFSERGYLVLKSGSITPAVVNQA